MTWDDRQVGEHHTVHQRRERLQPLPGGKGAREGGREGGRWREREGGREMEGEGGRGREEGREGGRMEEREGGSKNRERDIGIPNAQSRHSDCFFNCIFI